MLKATYIKIFTGITFFSLLFSCQKIVHGYLSDDVFYQVNPFEVQQGVTTVSGPLILNGSTAPLSVEILSLTDAQGNDAKSVLTTPQTITTFKSPITSDDTTLDLLNSKIQDSSVSPFNIGAIGGRLQFTAATSYVPAGTYNLGIKISNVNGQKEIPNACSIIIKPLDTYYSVAYFSLRTNDATGTNQIARSDNDETDLSYSIDYSNSQSDNKIILKFVDKNGTLFDPKNGEVADWSNDSKSTTYFPKLQYWAPYYKTEYTDTALVQQLPNLSFSFPYFELNSSNSGADGARIDNLVKNTSNGNILHTVLQFKLYTKGIYTITVHLNKVLHK